MKQLIRDLAGVACIAGFGGFIRTLVGKARHEPYNLKTGVTEVLIAVFAGFLAHWLGQEYVSTWSKALVPYCSWPKDGQ